MRFSSIRAGGMVALSAAVMALQGAPAALGQFVPYTGSPNQGYSQYQTTTAPTQQSPPQYTAMAFQGSGARAGTPTLNQPVGSVAPGPVQNYSSAPAAGCNCQAAPAVSYSQPAAAPAAYAGYSSGGCATGSCGGYNTFEGGGCGVGGAFGGSGTGCGGGGGYLGGGFGHRRGGHQWFGGFYGLYMERDGNPWKALAFSTPAANPAGYYPLDNEIVMNLTDLDNDTFAGAEVRFGSTLGQCGNFGWEAVYWGLLEETTTAIETDLQADANRLYGMIPHTGVFYNGRSANDYFDYAPPTANPAGNVIRVRQLTARNSFSMQNVELNFLRFPVFGGGSYSSAAGGAYGGGLGGGRGLGRRGGCGAGGCGTAGYGGCCGSSSCGVGGCDSCAGGSCGGGCGCGSRFSATGVIGVRYVRIDEDFMFRSDFEDETAATTGFLSRDIDVDSHLVGAQFGCNMVYRCGCSGRWALHCNSVFGVYGNHVEVWNRMDFPTGGPTPTFQNGDNFDIRYEDDDIAFLGELRAGASYQYSCNWRLFGGYRLIGMGGMALAFDQISQQNISAAQASYVDSDGSIFIHGLQSGVEFTY